MKHQMITRYRWSRGIAITLGSIFTVVGFVFWIAPRFAERFWGFTSDGRYFALHTVDGARSACIGLLLVFAAVTFNRTMLRAVAFGATLVSAVDAWAGLSVPPNPWSNWLTHLFGVVGCATIWWLARRLE